MENKKSGIRKGYIFCTTVHLKRTGTLPVGVLVGLLIALNLISSYQYKEIQVNRIFSLGGINERSEGKILRILYKEIEGIVSSKVTLIEGVVVSANTIKKISVDGKWRKWYMWKQRRSILEI